MQKACTRAPRGTSVVVVVKEDGHPGRSVRTAVSEPPEGPLPLASLDEAFSLAAGLRPLAGCPDTGGEGNGAGNPKHQP